jgi:hypothetical protein
MIDVEEDISYEDNKIHVELYYDTNYTFKPSVC